MSALGNAIDRISWLVVGILCVFLGLSPFVPEPHLVEKLRMLGQGRLTEPLDIFDLLMHGAPFLLALAKGARLLRRR